MKMCLNRKGVDTVLAGIFLCSVLGAPTWGADLLPGMSMMVEVYAWNESTKNLDRIGKQSLLSGLSTRPKGDFWFVRPVRSPASAWTPDDVDAIAQWLADQRVPGILFDPESGITDTRAKPILALADLKFIGFDQAAISDKRRAALAKQGIDITRVDAAWRVYQDKLTEKERNDPRYTASSFYLGASPETHGLPGTLPRGKYPIDYSLKLTPLDGKPVRLLDLKGKVIFLNFWATWCAPCRKEIPSLENLSKALANDPRFFFAYVAIQDPASVKTYLKANRLDLPVYTANPEATRAYTANGIPATIVVSKKGDWVSHHIGAAQWDTTLIFKTLLKLADEPANTHHAP